MDLVQQLVRERESDNSLIHQIRMSMGLNESTLVVCLEGWDDAMFYSHHIRQRKVGRRIEVIRCGKKKSVMWLRREVENSGLLTDRLMFFVDRDLDEYVDSVDYALDRLYVTDEYSFESFLVGDRAFDIVWGDLLGLQLRGELYESWRRRYLAYLAAVAKCLRSVGIASVSARRRGEKSYLNEVDQDRRLRLTSDGAFKIFGSMTSSAGPSMAAACIGQWRHVRKLHVELEDEADLKLARGKNLFASSCAFFRVLQESVMRRGSGVNCRRSQPLSDAYLKDSLSARMQCPFSLHEFLGASCVGQAEPGGWLLGSTPRD